MKLSLGPLAQAAIVAAALVGCSDPAAVGTSESFQTDAELATRALQILGAPKIEGAQQQCNRCHDINRKSLRLWSEAYSAATKTLADPTLAAEKKIAALRVDPDDPRSPYAATRLGFLAGGLHLPDLPESKALAAAFTEAFGAESGPSEYRRLREAARMPIAPDHDRLGKSEFALVKQWVDKGMPELDRLLPEGDRPSACEPMISEELREHVAAMKTKGWAARNREQAIPMFACADGSDPATCFTQKRPDGGDVFPRSVDVEPARAWAAEGTTIRILHEMPHLTSFWSRSSADGRFISSGGGEEGAFVIDLAAQLTSGGSERREIGVRASYDPSFMPDNSGLIVQGTGTHFCTQDLFANAATTLVTFAEPQCSKLDSVALYQSVGRRLADNALSDYFIVNNAFESDGGYGSDPRPSFGEDQKLSIKVMTAAGTESGYRIGQRIELPAPWEGDTMVSPSTQLLASRVAGESGQAGYSIRKLRATSGPAGYELEAAPIARICIPGGKASFSFDERFLVTHHYLTRSDFASEEAYAPYAAKAAADVYVVDLVSGETLRATHMGPGQLALYPHFRSDGFLYFLVRDKVAGKEYYAASDVTLKR